MIFNSSSSSSSTSTVFYNYSSHKPNIRCRSTPFFLSLMDTNPPFDSKPPPPSSSSTYFEKPGIARTNHPSPLHPSVDPRHAFSGNFAPVDELGPTECTLIEGEIPASLTGTYIRNGPNPQHIPSGPLHFFEGDGMLHSIQLSEGQAIYSCRYVRTYKFNLERDAGSQIFPNMLSGFYGLSDIFQCVTAVMRVAVGRINLMKGFGLANTSLASLSSKLLALGESDLPYLINLTPDGDIETLGRWDFDKSLFANMTAHPKTDIATNETFAFQCSPTFPFLTLFHFDSGGVKQNDVPISSLTQPTLIHDFAITDRFAVFSETQLVISASNVLLGKGMPVVHDKAKVPRIGVIPKYAATDAEMKWFDAPGFNPLHVINAWENGDDEVVLIAPNATSIENIFRKIEKVNFSLEKVRINLKTGDISRDTLSPRNLELGSINPSYTGRKNRYAYLGVGKEIPRMAGVVKIDLENGSEVSKRLYGPGCFGGEPLFVATSDGGSGSGSGEDDGFVVTFVHDDNSGDSKFLIMDAKSPNLDVVAALKMPRRVPFGFHGLFVRN